MQHVICEFTATWSALVHGSLSIKSTTNNLINSNFMFYTFGSFESPEKAIKHTCFEFERRYEVGLAYIAKGQLRKG